MQGSPLVTPLPFPHLPLSSLPGQQPPPRTLSVILPLNCLKSPSGATPSPHDTLSKTPVPSAVDPNPPVLTHSVTHTPSPIPSVQAESPFLPQDSAAADAADVKGSGLVPRLAPQTQRGREGLGHPQVTYRSLLERSAEVEHGWLPGRRPRADWLLCCLATDGRPETLDAAPAAAALRAVCPLPIQVASPPAPRRGRGWGRSLRPANHRQRCVRRRPMSSRGHA